MTEPNRYEAVIENDILYLEHEEGLLEVGSMDAIVELFGGETYTLEYTDRQSAAAWISTDDDNTIAIDVREELADWAYTAEFGASVADNPLDESGESGYPLRTEVFVDTVIAIWDAKGDID